VQEWWGSCVGAGWRGASPRPRSPASWPAVDPHRHLQHELLIHAIVHCITNQPNKSHRAKHNHYPGHILKLVTDNCLTKIIGKGPIGKGIIFMTN